MLEQHIMSSPCIFKFRDRILANVMIYWLTNSITSSVRFRDDFQIEINTFDNLGFKEIFCRLYKENAPQILGADKVNHIDSAAMGSISSTIALVNNQSFCSNGQYS